jgi:hypothetical protein
MSKELIESVELASMAILFICAGIVALGLICESQHFRPTINWAGECLVLIGVVGQTLAVGCVFFSGRRLLSINEYHIEILEKRAGEAELEAVRLSSIVRGLNVPPFQMSHIAKLGSQFRGEHLTLSAFAGDGSGALLAWQIRNVLEKEAGLQVADVPGGIRSGAYLKLGIHIYGRGNDRFQAALTDALDNEIMPVFNHRTAELPIPQPTSVTVIVCVQPFAGVRLNARPQEGRAIDTGFTGRALRASAANG